MFTSSFCPACGETGHSGHNLEFKFVRERFITSIQRCPGCTHSWLLLSPQQLRATEEAYNRTYSGFRLDPCFNKNVSELLRTEFRNRRPPPGRILDVGCGNGAFLEEAQKAGYEGQGIDISSEAVNLTGGRGLHATKGDFLTFEFGQQFDVITMWDVVEHLCDPIKFFLRANALLTPGGILFAKVPSYGRRNFFLVRRWNRLATILLAAPAHLQYFNPRSLAALCARSGFNSTESASARSLRGPPETISLRKWVGRQILGAANALCLNHNRLLYLRK